MSDRIDHADEARKHIGWTRWWQEEQGITPETGVAMALLAQAEATLALIEQQRIANLIALAALAGREDVQEEVAEVAYQAFGQLITYKPTGLDDEVLMLDPDIAAALGIEAVDHD